MSIQMALQRLTVFKNYTMLLPQKNLLPKKNFIHLQTIVLRSFTCSERMRVQNTIEHDLPNSNTQKKEPEQSVSSVFLKKEKKNLQIENETKQKETYFKRIWKERKKQKISQPEFDIEPKTKFGSLSDSFSSKNLDFRDHNERIEKMLPEDVEAKVDGRLKIPLTRDGRFGRNAHFYNKKIKRLAKQNKVDEALKVYEEEMTLQARVMPQKPTFVLLIGMCAHAGRIDKVFKLFKQMKHLGLDPPACIYTSLFNACATTSNKRLGLSRATQLLGSMRENQMQLNLTTTKAAMKAFALTGDLPKAFALMDDAAQRMTLDSECFNHLLMACISDRHAGFQRAIKVWLRMRDLNVSPGPATVKLLARAARDCQIGDLSSLTSDIYAFEQDHKRMLQSRANNEQMSFSNDAKVQNSANEDMLWKSIQNSGKVPRQMVSDPIRVNMNTVTNKKYEWWEEDSRIPSELKSISFLTSVRSDSSDKTLASLTLLPEISVYKDLFPHNSLTFEAVETSVIPALYQLSDLEKPDGRMALLGGAPKFLALLDELGVTTNFKKPDYAAWSQLLACLPDNELSDLWLLISMERRRIKPDIDLMNDIMMRRRKKGRESVKAIIPVLGHLSLTPNMRTYAALALTCKAQEDGLQLIEDMKAANLEPSASVMGHLVSASGLKFSYKRKLLEIMSELEISPTVTTLKQIEGSIAEARKRRIEAERNDPESYLLQDEFTIPFKYFINFYNQWLEKTEVQQSRLN